MKTVLITGANRGMGRQTGRELSGNGYRIYLGTRSPEANGEIVKDIKGETFWITIDVSESESIRRASKWLAERETTLDVLINNAGIFPDKQRSITNISRNQLVATFQINTFGQTGTYSTNRPRVWVRYLSSLCPLFQRTSWPSRQLLIPILKFFSMLKFSSN